MLFIHSFIHSFIQFYLFLSICTRTLNGMLSALSVSNYPE